MFPKYEGDYYGSFVFDEAKALVNKGFEVHIVTPYNEGAVYEEIMEGIHIHRFKWLNPNPFKALVHFKGFKDNLRLVTYIISLFFNLLWIMRKYNNDIIHAHSTVPTGLVGVIVAKIIRKPVFVTSHGMDINNFENNSIFKKLITFSLNNCNKAIAVSEDLAKKMIYLKINQKNITVLRNAVDTNRFKPLKSKELRKYYKIKDNEILILFVGYLDTFKGIFELINAFYEINKKSTNFKLMMVGEGPKDDELKRIISQLHLEKYVIFTGKIFPTNIHKYYQAADIFVLPSYSEGLPLSILEAMACGLPIVTTNVGGIPEVVKNGENGFIIPSKNRQLLAQKLEIIAYNLDLRKKFGFKSTEIIIKEFSIEKKVEELAKLYEELI
jgi:N-acetyl-alpha-D-glucosaminyl L-malate synthase BshA